MASDDRLSGAMQENILALLCFDPDAGNVIAGIVQPEHFEGPYREVAERVLEFRVNHKQPPGKTHLADLFDSILEDKEDPKHDVIRNIMLTLKTIERSGVNVDYVLRRTKDFVRAQTIKMAILKAGDRIQQGGTNVSDEVEQILNGALRVQVDTFDPGISLDDTSRSLAFLERAQSSTYHCGIKELDRRGLGPTRGEMRMMIGSAKAGKSWGLIHVGKNGFMQRANVLHVTLENSDMICAQRYYQSLFSVPKRMAKVTITDFTFDKLRRLEGFESRVLKPRFALDSPNVEKKLRSRIEKFESRLGRIRIKQFPTRQLSIKRLVSYLDMLERVERFIPDILIVDYPDLMYYDRRNPRLELGRLFEELRGLAVERNLCLETVTQSNRAGAKAKVVKGTDVGEDWSKVQTVDMAMTYSRTEDEKSKGLARLAVVASRTDEDGFVVLLSQNYAIGQFVISSALMDGAYWSLLKEENEKDSGDEEDEDEE